MKPGLESCRSIAFDLFGTILDLQGSVTPLIARFIEGRRSDVDPACFWQQFRHRQRIEQYQDTIVALGHTGYLETVEKAFAYVARTHGLDPTAGERREFIEGWNLLSPFPECRGALERLSSRFSLVALSNGNPWFLEHLVRSRIGFDFTDVISVETAGVFKPHPAVYRKAAQILKMEVGELLMVSANSFDVLGARTCGLRGAYVNRYGLPFEDTHELYLPDITVSDFSELADALLT